jgi:heptosyltransferase III
VIVLRPGALGDTLLAVPALRALRKAGYASLILAAHGPTARLLQASGEVEYGLAFDDPTLAWLFRDEPPPDEVVGWMQATRAPALKYAAVVAPSRPMREQHCAEYLVETLAPLGVLPETDARPLRVKACGSEEVLVHPGSGSPTKNWPAARFAEVIRALRHPVRLVVGEADLTTATDVEVCLGRALPRLEHAPLDMLAARLAGCRGYIGNDSGVSHLAGLCGARTVVLFGPTSPIVWRPLGPSVNVLSFDAPIHEVVAAVHGPPTQAASTKDGGSR